MIIRDTLFPDRDITLLDAFRNITEVVALIVRFIFIMMEMVTAEHEKSN